MIRKVSKSDFELLFAWRNDEEVVKNSRYQKMVSREEYEKWFDERLVDEKIHMFILEEDGEQVGQIKIEPNEKELLITYSVGKEHRGKGSGKKAVGNLEEFIRNNRDMFKDYDELVAYISAENQPSIAVFKSLDYYLKEGNEYYVKYARKIN